MSTKYVPMPDFKMCYTLSEELSKLRGLIVCLKSFYLTIIVNFGKKLMFQISQCKSHICD